MQEYAVKQLYKAERARLEWMSHQSTIRADKYQGLLDAVHANDDNQNLGEQPGQRIILAPSFYMDLRGGTQRPSRTPWQ